MHLIFVGWPHPEVIGTDAELGVSVPQMSTETPPLSVMFLTEILAVTTWSGYLGVHLNMWPFQQLGLFISVAESHLVRASFTHRSIKSAQLLGKWIQEQENIFYKQCRLEMSSIVIHTDMDIYFSILLLVDKNEITRTMIHVLSNFYSISICKLKMTGVSLCGTANYFLTYQGSTPVCVLNSLCF